MIRKRVLRVAPARLVLAFSIGFTAAFAARALDPPAVAPRAPATPATPVRPVTDVYFGTPVVDSYRWLENPSDRQVQSWGAAQTRFTQAYLDSTPIYTHFKARISALMQTPPYRYYLSVRRSRLIYLRNTPPNPQAQLVVLDHLGGAERVLFDPATAAINGVVPAIESVFVAPDGKTVAFTTEVGGAEDETLHVVDVDSGKLLPDTLPHIGGAVSPVALAWDGDGRGFVHTQWPKNSDGTYAKHGILLFHHSLGTPPTADRYVFGKELSPKSEYHLATSRDGSTQAIVTNAGDGVHCAVYLRRGPGKFALVATPDDAIGSSNDIGGAFVGNAFYAISKKRASRGEVIALEPATKPGAARTVIPASSLVIANIVPFKDGVISVDIDGGDSSARVFDATGMQRGTLPIPPISRARVAADPAGDGPIIISYNNYVRDITWLAYDSATNSTRDVGFPSPVPAAFSDVVTERVFVPSLDGKARIPLELIHARNIAHGSAPTILQAYGAYGVVTAPEYDPTVLAWLERGGVLAHAMIRGGGEYGEDWHLAARLQTKTISSDDLAACARWLAANGYADQHHLGIEGGSAGGFLMGLALTRNPELYRAVAAHVGIYDLLRFELTPNGAFNTPEFGTVKDPAQFVWMLAQSPYQNVHAGIAYPAVLMTTGENDPRVDPYNSRKMVALLQASTASAHPVLLVQRAGEGHGLDNSFDQGVENAAATYAFFDRELR
jgi:prolyl oligopeptidase